jgi:putative membrane protein
MKTSIIMRNFINAAMTITASAWVTFPAHGEIPVPTGDTGNGEPGDKGDSVPPLTERGVFAGAVLRHLHLANIREIMMGRRAEKRGQSKDVRDFGSLLVRDHSIADRRLLAFAKHQKIDVSATGQMLEERDTEGTGTFDEKFAKGMVYQHEKSIAEVRKAREGTTDDAFSTFLDSVLPMLEHHRDLAQEIVDKHRGREP